MEHDSSALFYLEHDSPALFYLEHGLLLLSTWKYEEERRWLDEVAPSSSYSFPVELSYVTVCFTGFISSGREKKDK
jgi:hypothetical protein